MQLQSIHPLEISDFAGEMVAGVTPIVLVRDLQEVFHLMKGALLV